MLITRHDTCIYEQCFYNVNAIYNLSLAINEFTLRIFSVHFLGLVHSTRQVYLSRKTAMKNWPVPAEKGSLNNAIKRFGIYSLFLCKKYFKIEINFPTYFKYRTSKACHFQLFYGLGCYTEQLLITLVDGCAFYFELINQTLAHWLSLHPIRHKHRFFCK